MLTFCGQTLLLGDPAGELLRWLDRTLPLSDLQLFAERTVAQEWTRPRPHSNVPHKTGLPIINWPTPPRSRINAVCWPTGASRWARGLFLSDGATLQRILAAAGEAGEGVLQYTEYMAGENPWSYQWRMHLLSPRAITVPKDLIANPDGLDLTQLWLLPLVDARYFWQWKPASTVQSDTWTDLLQGLFADLGVATANYSLDDLADEYATHHLPHLEEWARAYENAAQLLDAAAWCVGQRILAFPGATATYASDTPVRSLERLRANRTECGPYVVAGAHSYVFDRPQKPARVSVVFPPYLDGEPDEGREPWSEEVTLADLAAENPEITEEQVAQTIDVTKTYFDPVPAEWEGIEESEFLDPLNHCDLRFLAKQIAKDYYTWRWQGVWDLAFGGVNAWVPTGFDDYVIWHLGSQEPSADLGDGAPMAGEYHTYTRVSSLPDNCEVGELLHRATTTSTSSTSSTSTIGPTTTASGATSTSTSTTPNPCSGFCRWTWSATDGQWSLDSDGCSLSTSSTSSTSSTTESPTTTSTTEGPTSTTHRCATTTTAAPTTTGLPTTATTFTTSTTSTTPRPCQCQYPAFCGVDDGDCTYTFCISYDFDNAPPPCSQSTTPDPGTTTTDACCEWQRTSTTEPAYCHCSGTCQWVADCRFAGWALVSTPTNPCGRLCICEYPRSAPSPGNCTAETTFVEEMPPEPVEWYCVGDCDWVSDDLGQWILIRDGCRRWVHSGQYAGTVYTGTETGSAQCLCASPSYRPTSCCIRETTWCKQKGFPTKNPCLQSSTAAPTTTTTPAPCDSWCKWRWTLSSGGTTASPPYWSIVGMPCDTSCPCGEPFFDGEEDCEIAWTKCGAQTTSTTLAPCEGSCRYVYNCGEWHLAYGSCDRSLGCYCPPPDILAEDGDSVDVPCGDTTTTTLPPTTTETSTTAPTTTETSTTAPPTTSSSTTEGPTSSSTTEGPTSSSTTEGPTSSSTTEGPTSSSTTEEPPTSTTPQPTSTTEEPPGSTTSDSPTTGEPSTTTPTPCSGFCRYGCECTMEGGSMVCYWQFYSDVCSGDAHCQCGGMPTGGCDGPGDVGATYDSPCYYT